MNWFIIDEHGTRPIPEQWMTHQRQQHAHELAWGVWRSFSHVAVRSEPEGLMEALQRLVAKEGMCFEVLHKQGAGASMVIATQKDWSVVHEPQPQTCVLHSDSVDDFFEELDCEGLFYGYEEEGSVVHFAHFEQGRMTFLWVDAQEPGPSFALTFHEDGQCTEQDARWFAHEHMGLSEDVTQIDRFAFLARLIRERGLNWMDPHLGDATITHALSLIPTHDTNQG